MGIADVRRAFQEQIGDRGTVTDCKMNYVKGDAAGQQFRFSIVTPDGSKVKVEALFPNGSDPNDQAKKAGALYRDSLVERPSPEITNIDRDETGKMVIKRKAVKA